MTKNLSYLSYPLPPDIQRLFEAGDFDRMARVIRQRLEDPRVPKTLHERLRFQLIIAKEIPEYYRLTQADMLAILQENINDFTEDELEALRDDGTLDWRYINGEVHFRNNCLDALLKVRKEYALRAKDPEVQAAADARGQRLNAMITRMKEEGGMHVRFELHEEMTVKSDRLTPGETLRIHLPLPVVGAQVKSAALLSTSHPAAFIAPADEPQRTVYFELPYEPGMTVSAELAYEIEAPYCQPHAREVLAAQRRGAKLLAAILLAVFVVGFEDGRSLHAPVERIPVLKQAEDFELLARKDEEAGERRRTGRIVAAVERHGIDLIVVGQHVPPFEIGLRRSQVAGEGLVVLRITEPHVDARNAHGDTSFERSRRLSPCGETAEQQQGYNPDFFHVIHRFLV